VHTYFLICRHCRGCRGRDRMVVGLDLRLPMHSVPITTKVVSSNPAHGEMYSIQHHVIKFAGDLWQIYGFLRVVRLPSAIELTATI
jgi:hypothetical protein